MSEPSDGVPAAETDEPDAAPDSRRTRRLQEVFGDVLPDATRDERSDAWGDGDVGSNDDEWLRNQVPPHHG